MGPTGRFAPVGPGTVLQGHEGDPKGKSDELIDTSIEISCNRLDMNVELLQHLRQFSLLSSYTAKKK